MGAQCCCFSLETEMGDRHMQGLHAACEPARNPEYRIHPEWSKKSPTEAPRPDELLTITQRAIDMYMLSRRPNGTMGGIGWWQAANGYTAMALHDLWSGSTLNYHVLDESIKKCANVHAGLINEFNDDSLWWAMCCTYMFQLGHDSWYLDTATKIWHHIQTTKSICGRGQMKFRDWDMEGGCYWNTRPNEGQINSISTGLYAELSARLALQCASEPTMHESTTEKGFGTERSRASSLLEKLMDYGGPASKSKTAGVVTRDQLIEAARCSLGWVLRCRYRPDDGVVLDGFLTKRDKCNDWTFTYNTGVAISVCALLYQASGDEEYIILACHMANKAMRRRSWVEDNGVLTERGAFGPGHSDPAKDNDSVGFKSVLFRHLCTLYNVIKAPRVCSSNPWMQRTAEMIKRFVLVNFESQLERNTNGKGQYGPWWNGPMDLPTSHSQMAVLDVMAGVHLIARL